MASQGQENTSTPALGRVNGAVSSMQVPVYSYESNDSKQESKDIPAIPSIPTSLMVPPSSVVSVGTTSTVNNEGIKRTIKSLQEPGGSYNKRETMQDLNKIHQNLDNIQSHVVREANVLQELHSQLSIKAHEMDRLRAEINQHERQDREALQRSQLPLYVPTVPQPSDLRSGFSKTIAMPTVGSGTSDTDSIAREYNSKIEDLKTRLRMTTELCAKQDSYYRDIIKELEDRLTETINGRDHILTLRDKEAANQMGLIRQLEAALRKQQQLNSDKEETIVSLEERFKHLEGCLSQSLSIIDKLKQLANEEEIKRGRPAIIHGCQDTRNKEITFITGDMVIQTIQKCLFEDSNENKLLNAKLEKVIKEHQQKEKELKTKNEQQKQDYESKLDAVKKEHTQALDMTSSQTAKINEESENLRHQLDSVKRQHKTEVSSLVDKTTVLQQELAKIVKDKNDAVSEYEKKFRELQNENNDAKVELKLSREEKEKLLLSLSQEQANNITLKEKLSTAEAEKTLEKERVLQIIEEKDVIETKLKEEIEQLRTKSEEYKTLLIQREEEFYRQAEKEIEEVAKEEQGKANDRLNIILFELNKVNDESVQIKTELEIKNTELNKFVEENNKMRESLEKREQEMALIREEKLELAAKHEQRVKEVEHLQKELGDKIEYSEKTANELDNAHILMTKLKTQLDEREKTIASFREQGTNLAEILERNNLASDSLQREREELVKKVEEQVVEVQEMKKHREILAKKLKTKDKRLKEIEEEKDNLQKTVILKNEELAAWTDERESVLSELKAKQLEAAKLREERDSLNNLLEGKDGQREKEIGKLISRLKGSEQGLSLTKKLLKSKGEMSGKAVRVAESMQREVTEKRGEMDALLNKIHWLQENLNAAVKDKMYYESKSSRLSEELKEVALGRDQLRFNVQQTQEECENYQKQLNHLEQALEKAALKYADSQSVIEKLEQDLARLKLKHSLEIKEQERNLKAGSTLLKVDAATIGEILARVNAGLRLPIVSGQEGLTNTSVPLRTPVMAQPITLQNLSTKTPQNKNHETPLKDNEVQQDLKCLLQDVRTLISSFQAHLTQSSVNPTPLKHSGLQNTNHEPIGTRQITDQGHKDQGPRTRGPYIEDAQTKPSNSAEYQNKDQHIVEHDSESQFDESFDFDKEYLENMRPPLRSSSPKPDNQSSLATDNESYFLDLPLRDLGDGNDSDVKSLLSFATAVSGDTLDHRISMETPSAKTAKIPSVKRGQRYVSSVSTHPSNKPNKENTAVRRTGSRISHKKTSKRKEITSTSPPSYERAELMLRSLAQTGSHLTKKNKEIARLLNEQDRRIKKCRDNEQGIQTLLQ